MTHLLALLTLFSLSEPVLTTDTFQVEFVILNDDQRQTVDVTENSFLFSPPLFTPRDNVILTSWYQDDALTIWHDFDAPITSNLTLYSEWRYRGTSLSPATLRRSQEGQRFESNTMMLYFDLYEPLAYQVRYQWQSARLGEQNFEDIGGAVTNAFSPYRNGTFQYRIEYKIPVYNDAGLVVGSIPYYSEPVIIEIFGQQTLFIPITLLTFTVLFLTIVFFRRKRLIFYEVDGGFVIPPSRFRVGEDTSLQPKAKKPGYRFQGWYLDPNYEFAFKGMRMPLKSMRLYAKFKRTQKKN
jgi:hypothetical protein